MGKKKIAIIGSFQRPENYSLVQEIIQNFREHNVVVVSPCGTQVTDKREGFVVFESDNHELSNEKIQYDTLKKIFTADVVYVVNKDGYMGRTTCYEIGRILERKIPLYFYTSPIDLPICVTDEFIVQPNTLMEIVHNSAESILNLECSSCIKEKICVGGRNEQA